MLEIELDESIKHVIEVNPFMAKLIFGAEFCKMSTKIAYYNYRYLNDIP